MNSKKKKNHNKRIVEASLPLICYSENKSGENIENKNENSIDTFEFVDQHQVHRQ
jgi:hypothetical protein